MTGNSILSCSIKNLCLYSFIGLCSAYLTTLTRFSPYYFGLGITFLFSFILLLYNEKIQLNSIIRKNLSFLSLIVFYTFINASLTNTMEKLVSLLFLVFINQGSVLAGYVVCSKCNRQKIKNALNLYFYIAVIIGIIDFMYRIATRSDLYTGSQFFYNFKGTSVMFTDSNWVGFIYMIAFSFFLYLNKEHHLVTSKKVFILFFICFFSFSRAAQISCILVYLYAKYHKAGKKTKKYILIFIIICFTISAPSILFFLSRDDSFQTKLVILKGLANYLQYIPTEKLFIGFGSEFATSDAAGVYTNSYVLGHLYLVIKIMDMGFIGLFLDFVFFYFLFVATNKKFTYLFIPFFICGLSMCPTNLSYLFVFAGIMLNLENMKESKISNV